MRRLISSGGAPTVRLSDGFPAPTATDPVNLSGSLQAVLVDFKSTRAQQYNLFVEREFAGNVSGGGYLGWRAANVMPTSSTNASAIGVGNINLAPAAPRLMQPRRRYAAQLPNISSNSLLLGDYEANYNAFQTVFQGRQQRGLTLSTSYTLAHGEATAPTPWDATLTGRFNADLVIRHRWAAFVAQPANTAGNTGRNTLYGPPQRRLDMSLFNKLPLTDAMRLQLRVEAFNVTNTPSFANPNAALGAPGFGSITSTGNSIPGRCSLPRS
jgi:hypothetical protein